ncbi:MAG: T9SS type A sorting domain-containing protein, partial [Saprospiraceae bacterium]|nr:T9SS type A sorting domain-containing protein [Saprospiraceae bacterium]
TNNGASYSPVNFYNRNDEFVNNVREFDSVVIPGPFTSTTRLRFRHSASANSDRTYFDDVVITGCLNSAREAEEDVLAEPHAAELAPEPTETVSDLNLFPNPTRDLLQVQFNLREGAQVQLMVTDLTGRQIELRQFTGVAGPQTTEIQAGQWSPGFYFLHLLTDDGQRVSKKFVVTR